jgi:integrase
MSEAKGREMKASVSHGERGRQSRGQSSRNGAKQRQQASKPYPSFPLTPHRNGQFCKKIRGKIVYFGTVSDPDAALKKYHAHCDALHAGEITSVPRASSLTVGQLANYFLEQKIQQREAGRLEARTVADYRRACDAMVDFFGSSRDVLALPRSSFRDFQNHLAEGVSAKTLEGRVRCMRVILKFAYDEELVDRPIRFERDLKGPTQRELRRERQLGGRRDFTAAEIRSLLGAAKPQMQAMILLGINCALGNKEIALLPKAAIDLEHGWLTYPRPKTGVDRRCPLWPETVDAIKRLSTWTESADNPEGMATEQRIGVATTSLLFITKNGLPFVRNLVKDLPDGRPGVTEIDGIAPKFQKLANKLGIPKPRPGFYGLRRCCETIGAETGQQVAVDHIMGHAPAAGDMSAIYRQRVGEAPLRQVTEHVRAWLFSS